jgi:hypothetical protein
MSSQILINTPIEINSLSQPNSYHLPIHGGDVYTEDGGVHGESVAPKNQKLRA